MCVGTIGGFTVSTLQFAVGATVAVSTLISVEELNQTGTEGRDMLVGANIWLFRNVLDDGNDLIFGGDGNDIMYGCCANAGSQQQIAFAGL